MAFLIPYACFRPTSPAYRVWNSGNPQIERPGTFFMSLIVFSPYCFATAFVTPIWSVSKNGVGVNSVMPRFASAAFAWARAADGDLGTDVLWKTTLRSVPRYSG